MVIEAGAIHAPRLGATTVSMDNGTNNTAWGWYEQGFNTDSPLSGFPTAGSTIQSQTFPDHSYTLAPDYRTNNALLVDTNVTTATLTLQTPAALTGLSFLTAAGHGPITVGVTIHHANGTTETNSFSSPDWFNTTDSAYTANGRLDVGSYAYGNVDSGSPSLLTADVTVANSSPVTAIDFNGTAAGGGHAFVFAVSGETQSGAGFAPLALTGFNADAIVEATATHPLTSLDATTASMDAGVANTGYSWYAAGYNTNSTATNNFLSTGLPTPGSTVTNAAAQDHQYVLPASYTANNAVLVDSSGNSGTLTLASPKAYSALSFLTSAGGGAVTISYTVNHEDGSADSGVFVSPDWFNGDNPAVIANGRVGVQNGALDAVGGNNPRLYSVDILLDNTASPVTSIDLIASEGTGHAAIFAVSGATGSVVTIPTVITQPVGATVSETTPVQFTAQVNGTLPLTYTWQVQPSGETNFVNVANNANVSGANTPSLSINSAAFANNGQYRLVATNSSGAVTTTPVTLTVLSTAQTVLSTSDLIEPVGTNSPAAEVVANAIDQTTSKYLNFGTDGNNTAPFVGPVGLIVTPSLGSDVAGTIVTALRLYTANDAPERDPASFTLEGSNDGTNFTQIAAGPLALPDARNAAGLSLDPFTLPMQEVDFTNNIPYKSYRLLFSTVKNNTTANSMQIGEVDLLGTVATSAPAQVNITRNTDGTLTITSSQAGTLQSTTALQNANTVWTDEGPINGSVTISATAAAKFYRILVQQ
jgi:hypothetical protein